LHQSSYVCKCHRTHLYPSKIVEHLSPVLQGKLYQILHSERLLTKRILNLTLTLSRRREENELIIQEIINHINNIKCWFINGVENLDQYKYY
jgi:hypothetical protein